MTAHIQLKNFTDEIFFGNSKYEEIDKLPFMKSPIPLFTVISIYFLFVLKIGPAFMKNRKPYKLKNTLIIYNSIQVLLSFYLFQRYMRYILRTGVVYSKCYMNDEETRKEILDNIWWYAFAKVTELLDTVFFVLRKKYNQVSFLHIYHHSLMLSGTWLYLKYTPSDIVTFTGSFNSFVHVVMYTYYALAAAGPHFTKYLTWKKLVTTLQLIQFVCVFFVYLGQLIYTDCPPPRWIATFIVINNFYFMYLFSKFYFDTYVKTPSGKTKSINNKVD